MTDWSEAMSVGHRGIDDQHRGLVERVKALNAALSLPDDAVSVETVAALAAEFLTAYKAHIAFEELAMHQYYYANVDRHAEHHAVYLEALTTLMTSDPVVEALRVNQPFINSAVFDHIDRDDRDFGAHLRASGLYGKV